MPLTLPPIPVSQVPVNQMPVNQIPVNQIPGNQLPDNQIPHCQMAQVQMPVTREDKMKNTNITFREWAGILSCPPVIDPLFRARIDDLQNAITIPNFQDVLANWFDANHKTADPDKIFPREARIDALKKELQNGGTQKPVTFDKKQEGGNEQWRWYVKTNYQISAKDIELPDGLWNDGGTLYAQLKGNEPTRIVSAWKKSNPHVRRPVQAPVTALENAYIDYIKGHIGGGGRHRGRDETFEQLKLGISSSFAKGLIAKLNAMCPGCNKRIQQSKDAAKKAEPQRAEARAQRKRKADNDNFSEERQPTKKSRQTKKSPSLASSSTTKSYHNIQFDPNMPVKERNLIVALLADLQNPTAQPSLVESNYSQNPFKSNPTANPEAEAGTNFFDNPEPQVVPDQNEQFGTQQQNDYLAQNHYPAFQPNIPIQNGQFDAQQQFDYLVENHYPAFQTSVPIQNGHFDAQFDYLAQNYYPEFQTNVLNENGHFINSPQFHDFGQTNFLPQSNRPGQHDFLEDPASYYGVVEPRYDLIGGPPANQGFNEWYSNQAIMSNAAQTNQSTRHLVDQALAKAVSIDSQSNRPPFNPDLIDPSFKVLVLNDQELVQFYTALGEEPAQNTKSLSEKSTVSQSNSMPNSPELISGTQGGMIEEVESIVMPQGVFDFEKPIPNSPTNANENEAIAKEEQNVVHEEQEQSPESPSDDQLVEISQPNSTTLDPSWTPEAQAEVEKEMNEAADEDDVEFHPISDVSTRNGLNVSISARRHEYAIRQDFLRRVEEETLMSVPECIRDNGL